MKNTEFATELRKIADLYDKIDDLPQISSPFNLFMVKREFLSFLPQLGSIDKKFDASYFEAVPKCAPLLTININRESVCNAKIVGTRVVPAVHIPERVENVIEWECQPLLKRGEELQLENSDLLLT